MSERVVYQSMVEEYADNVTVSPPTQTTDIDCEYDFDCLQDKQKYIRLRDELLSMSDNKNSWQKDEATSTTTK